MGDMQFETACPNDHTIRFSLELAGRTGHCPKCSAKFTIPSLAEIRESFGDDIDEEMEAAFKEAEVKQAAKKKELLAKKKAALEEKAREAREAATRAEQEKKEAEEAKAQKAKEETPTPTEEPSFFEETSKKNATEPSLPPTEEKKEKQEEVPTESFSEANATDDENRIQFMCPNGHILTAPAERAGKADICPECHVKFLVPDLEEDEEEEPVHLEIEENPEATNKRVVIPPGVSDEEKPPIADEKKKVTVSPGDSTAAPAFLYPDLAIKDGHVDVGLDDLAAQIPEALRVDPMAKVFWRLWNRYEKNETMKIHTTDGQEFVPLEFHETESLSPVGFFDVKDASGQSLRLVIRWDNIAWITLAGAEENTKTSTDINL